MGDSLITKILTNAKIYPKFDMDIHSINSTVLWSKKEYESLKEATL